MDQLRRLGYSVDWQRQRFTLDKRLSEAVSQAFVRLHQQGLIYRGEYLVNWCPASGSAAEVKISNHNKDSVIFDKVKGRIRSWRFIGEELIQSGPEANFWRAPTDNDLGNGMPQRCAMWRDVETDWELVNIDIQKSDYLVKMIATSKHNHSSSTLRVEIGRAHV